MLTEEMFIRLSSIISRSIDFTASRNGVRWGRGTLEPPSIRIVFSYRARIGSTVPEDKTSIRQGLTLGAYTPLEELNAVVPWVDVSRDLSMGIRIQHMHTLLVSILLPTGEEGIEFPRLVALDLLVASLRTMIQAFLSEQALATQPTLFSLCAVPGYTYWDVCLFALLVGAVSCEMDICFSISSNSRIFHCSLCFDQTLSPFLKHARTNLLSTPSLNIRCESKS